MTAPRMTRAEIAASFRRVAEVRAANGDAPIYQRLALGVATDDGAGHRRACPT